MKADLHCHTTLSDGSLGIEEVIAQAKRNGIDCLAITDHDSLSSVSRAVVLGQRYGIEIMPGVEFSAFDGKRNTKVHVLCYLPEKPDRLEGLCMRNSEMRRQRGKKMALKVIEKYPVTLENIVKYSSGSKAVYKCHIMHALMDYGYTTDLYGDVYEELFDPVKGLCAEEVSNETMSNPEIHFVLELIHSSGGIAVIAHPRVFDNFELIEELAKAGKIDGVEVWHQSLKPGDEERLLGLCEKYNLIATGGSDFHGFYNHYPISIGYNLTPEKNVKRLLELHKNKKAKEKEKEQTKHE